MTIKVDSEIRVFSEDEFHVLAEKIIGITFDVHNDFGRLMNEDVYKNAIRGRCEASGIIPARREVEVEVCHQDFRKKYYMDLLFAYGLMVEAKTVERLSKSHHAQTLHYLLLTGMHHGLLVNLRPGKVERQFVSTSLDLLERRRYVVRDSDWKPLNEASKRLRKILIELLDDWGAFLQTMLYREAIIHFFGGPEIALRRITIYDGYIEVGTHEVCLLADDTAFSLTSLTDSTAAMREHLQRFLGHTRLSCLQWINMNKHEIELRTLTKGVAE